MDREIQINRHRETAHLWTAERKQLLTQVNASYDLVKRKTTTRFETD